ncbi:MAG: dTDP-4-amino-4,6-dideoxygalactose transaminase [Eubacterium sp.]|nr:dTDP-4-amino-4,6-dideoxygalactose transaminase [Eubacterium sp.]
MISFNEPIMLEKAFTYVREAIDNKKLSGDGEFTKRCSYWLERWCGRGHVFLTTSCTHATEMAAMLAGIQPGDEVIMPAYTFVSTADAFVLRGARVKFIDIRPDTMNLDESLIEAAITEKTRAVVPVHYAGVGCEMDKVMEIAKRHHLLVIEDAAQGVMSTYKGQALGSIGDFGCYSFHETKNYSMGEGGAIAVRDNKMVEMAEIIREKGTDRSRFFRGQVDKYTWVEAGSSYLPSELNAAYLWAQLEQADQIFRDRMRIWKKYEEGFRELVDTGKVELPYIPQECSHNAHMFYIKVKDLEERTRLISYMKSRGIILVFHYVPLHTAPAGRKYGEFVGEDRYTTKESERLVRLPLYYGMKEVDVERVIYEIFCYYGMCWKAHNFVGGGY